MDLGVPEEFRQHVSGDGRRASLADAGLKSVPEWLSALTSLPDSLADLTGLTELNLWGNRLTALPDWLANLTALTELNLGENQLSSLPDWLVNLTSLILLDLSGNQLTTVPAQVDALLSGGTEVMLEGNPLADEPPWLPSS